MSMPDYYATLEAIGTNPSCAPMLADKFEEAGMDWHASYFREGYKAPRTTDELVRIIRAYGLPDIACRNERFTAALCYILVRGSMLIERVPTFDIDVVVVSGGGITVEERLADYNLLPIIVRTKPFWERPSSRSNPNQQEITFE